jgi:hypothetical protein
MFRNVATGKTTKDADYPNYYNMNARRVRVANAKIAREIQAAEDFDEVTDFIAEHEDCAAFHAFFENESQYTYDFADAPGTETLSSMQDIQARFEDCYAGEWTSEIEYTEALIDGGVFGDVTEGTLGNYIDVHSLSRDLFINDMMSIDIPTGGVFVFHNI